MKKKILEEKYCVILYFQGDQFYLDQNLNTTKGAIEMKKEIADNVAIREYNKLQKFNMLDTYKICVKKVEV